MIVSDAIHARRPGLRLASDRRRGGRGSWTQPLLLAAVGVSLGRREPPSDDRSIGCAASHRELPMTAAGRRRRRPRPWARTRGPGWSVPCGGAIGVYERCLAVVSASPSRSPGCRLARVSARLCARRAPITAPATRRAPQAPAIPDAGCGGTGSRSWSCRSASRRCRWVRMRRRGDAGGSRGWDAAGLDRTLIVSGGAP
jgi:hypothetical protein